MGLLDRLEAETPRPEAPNDFARIMALPRRERPDLTEAVDVLTRFFGKGDVACNCKAYHRRCVRTLQPTQAWAIMEAAEYRGLLGPIGVGEGKTLLDLLTPMAMPDCKVAALLVPPGLRAQLLDVDWEFYGQHWNLPNLVTSPWRVPGRPYLHVIAYSELSGAKSADLLDRIKPDLIILDEAHNLRRREAARTKRFNRYLREHPETRLCAWSGTLTSKSMLDYCHLSNYALKAGSPTPLHYPTAQEWAEVIDPSDFPQPAGRLKAFCNPGESLHHGWRRRVQETPGVVSSLAGGNCPASLIFIDRKVAVPSAVAEHITEVESSWKRPDEEELIQATDKARCIRQLACGFFYRWVYPKGEPLTVRERWLEARRNWHRELRERLKFSRRHLDSPLLCAKAAIRHYEGYKGDLPTWAALAWPEWKEVHNTVQPETEAVWVDDFLVRDAAEWARTNTGIVWYEHDAFGRAVAKAAGIPFYGPGADASAAIITESGTRSIVASIRAHGTGKNLQMFRSQLVANPPSDGGTWEQLVGRTHRAGQLADEVEVHVYRHVDAMREALDKARDLAAYIEGTMGGSQKLLRAEYRWSIL